MGKTDQATRQQRERTAAERAEGRLDHELVDAEVARTISKGTGRLFRNRSLKMRIDEGLRRRSNELIRPIRRVCIEPGCEARVHAQERCRTHYDVERRGGAT